MKRAWNVYKQRLDNSWIYLLMYVNIYFKRTKFCGSITDKSRGETNLPTILRKQASIDPTTTTTLHKHTENLRHLSVIAHRMLCWFSHNRAFHLLPDVMEYWATNVQARPWRLQCLFASPNHSSNFYAQALKRRTCTLKCFGGYLCVFVCVCDNACGHK